MQNPHQQHSALTDHAQSFFCVCFVVSVITWLRLFGFWRILSFLPFAVSMEICVCLVGEAQRPAERVSTVNIDHNTIYWVRCNQLAPGGSITMETWSKHTVFFSHVHSNWCSIQNVCDVPWSVIWGLCLCTAFSLVQLEESHISEYECIIDNYSYLYNSCTYLRCLSF